jgi:hypothetical protein
MFVLKWSKNPPNKLTITIEYLQTQFPEKEIIALHHSVIKVEKLVELNPFIGK